MEIKLTMLRLFFENPIKEYGIRELSRLIKINHTTVRQYLNKFVKEGYLLFRQDRIYSLYRLNLNKKTLNLKLYYNLEKLRESNLIEDLEKFYDYPTIILFGSYSQAMDDDKSDVDIAIITKISKKFSVDKYEKQINRKISLHMFKELKKSNLTKSICNGIVLSGEIDEF